MSKEYFRKVCQFSYRDYLFNIVWDEEKKGAILYGNTRYNWKCPDMTIRNIIEWWCDCHVDYHVRLGNKLALDMLISTAPFCFIEVEDIHDYYSKL